MRRQHLRHALRLFFVALQFLTRVPVPAWTHTHFQPAWLNACVAWFPAVGALVGVFGAAVLWLAGQAWPPAVSALLAVTATVWLTGAFHEDGLADSFDALGGAVPRERALEIMKDSRIGSYGAAALVLGLALRTTLLATLAATDLALAAQALVAAHLLGRAAAVGVMATLPYAGDVAHAKAKPLATALARSAAIIAIVSALALLVVPVAAYQPARTIGAALAAIAAVLLVVLAMRRWLARRLGGYTGDTLGASEQLGEIVVLMAWAAGVGVAG